MHRLGFAPLSTGSAVVKAGPASPLLQALPEVERRHPSAVLGRDASGIEALRLLLFLRVRGCQLCFDLFYRREDAFEFFRESLDNPCLPLSDTDRFFQAA
jgi:hypothetical protein